MHLQLTKRRKSRRSKYWKKSSNKPKKVHKNKQKEKCLYSKKS